MDELLTCSCQMKTDLENSADTFSFFKENYPLSSLTNNLNALSKQELRCACCLMGVALIKMSQKKTICGMCAVKCPRHAIYDLRGLLSVEYQIEPLISVEFKANIAGYER